MRRTVLGAGLLLVGLVLASTPVAAQSVGECPPRQITQDTTLTRTCPDGFRIVTDGVTFDLGGYRVENVTVLADDVVVRSGQVGGDAQYSLIVEGDDAVLTGLRVFGFEDIGFNVYGDRMTLTDSVMAGSWNGVELWGDDATVTDNQFLDNWRGVKVFGGARATISDNAFRRNLTGVEVSELGEYGGTLTDGATDTVLQRNTIRGGYTGIRVYALADTNSTVIRDNDLGGQSSGGISVSSATPFEPSGVNGASYTVIEGNRVVRAGGDGISVDVPRRVAATIVVGGNRAQNNAGYGIDAPGVTDGGGNIARRNGEGSCIGVTCR